MCTYRLRKSNIWDGQHDYASRETYQALTVYESVMMKLGQYIIVLVAVQWRLTAMVRPAITRSDMMAAMLGKRML